MKNTSILFIIGILVLGYFLFVNIKPTTPGSIFALLPIGQYNQYKDASGNCVYTSNVDPIGSRYSYYTGSDAWVAVDFNRDGTHDKFGWVSSKSTSNTLGLDECNVDKSALLVDNYNSLGDDIFAYTTTSGAIQIHVCSVNHQNSKFFNQDYGASANAILCGTVVPCTDECSVGARECVSSTSYRACGNYDADSCREWRTTNCASGATCSGAGVCSTTTSNCDTLRSAVVTAAQSWATSC